MVSCEIVPRPGTMDAIIIAEMERDIYGARERIATGDVVIDAGANIGAFARFVLRETPTARVFCIEPMPSNVEALRRNLDGVSNCQIIAAALVGEPGSVLLHDYGAVSSACHSLLDIGARTEGTFEVPGVTLAQIAEQYGIDRIAFWKLDIQGAEFDVIAKCPSALLRRVTFIAMETHASIANADSVLGNVPEYGRKLAELVKKLKMTHVCVLGYPTRRGGILGWASRESLNWSSLCRYNLRWWLGGPVAQFRESAILLGVRFLPSPVKKAIRRFIRI